MTRLRRLLPAAEAALVGVSLVAVVSFWRLFETGPFLGPLLLTLVAAHGTMIVTRRLGWELWAVALVSVAGALLTLTWILYPSTTAYLLPSRATIDAAASDLADAWQLFQEVRAPAPIATGFLLVAGLAIWAVAFIADWAAFRVWVSFEAVIPAGTVFVFASLFSAPRQRFLAAVLFITAVLGFVLLHRVARQQTSAAWLPSQIHEGVGALLSTGAGLVAVAVVVAAVVAPFVPGSRSEALVDYRGGGGEGGRVVLSPFVSIEAKLNELANVEMFTVRSTQRSYWRLTSLDEFDGVAWTYSRPFGEASGDLPQSADPPAGGEVQAVQEFEILRLGEIWMPAAYRPVSISDERYQTRWEPDSATLAIDERYEDSDGNRYTVVSDLPRLDPAVLRGADPTVPADVREVYLGLPLNFPDEVQQLAEEVTQGQETTYDRAMALQNFLHSDEFAYDKDVSGGGGTNAIVEFLFSTRRGFCQQFAGSYAAMARSIGIPTRVAVGFTTGEERSSEPGVYHVSGANAHTWPEVYLGEFGWVPFEPTPNRGIPGAESYTGLVEAQAPPGDPSTATTARPSGVDDPFEGDVSDTTIAVEAPSDGGAAAGSAEGGVWPTIRRWAGRLLVVALIMLGVAALALAAVPVARTVRRARRRRRAEHPGERVRVAWEESVESAEMLGVIHRPWETPAEFARRARTAVDGGSFAALADTLAAADFSPAGADDADATRAAELAGHIGEEARQAATREQRLRSWFDPRPPERWPTSRAATPVAADDYEPVAANAPKLAVMEPEPSARPPRRNDL
jgi:transglutaminase-like putative cysteine protease